MIDPADRGQLFELLHRHRVTLKHRFGQNFLVDPVLRDHIAETAGIESDDEVLEVGAGVGTLTIALAELCRRVVAVELDRTIIKALREVVAGHGDVEVVQADILRYDLQAAFPSGGEVATGNIPYNLTGALIRKLLDDAPRPRRLSLVVQKEVAERWTADTGAGVGTVAVQVFAVPRIVSIIPAVAFEPQPAVDSALVVMDVRERPAVNVADLNSFFRFVEAVFQQRRKQLGGTLGRISGTTSSEAASRLRDAGIDPERRPQTLSLQEWERVYTGFSDR
ncbi:MAG: ribosomal RNA small subunit methyltransferase A [Chloroflexi bacterium]|nr:MAG: ribosomal RNA small subunit methyltransferase A [Chloroflexota bacterium]